MKSLLIILAILSSLQVYAQIATAPDGASSVSAPPVGDNRRSNCGSKACFQVNIQPFCFGTNLRGYSHDIQLVPNQPVSVKLNIGGAPGDKLDFVFPATLTFDPNGVKPTCLAKSGQDMTTSGPKNFICKLQKSGVEHIVEYRIADWRGSKNAACYANGGYRGQTYCDYAARPLLATRISGTVGDQYPTCFYSFTGAPYNLKNEVICQFPSLMADESASVQVKINGLPGGGEVKAYTNTIEGRFPIADLPFLHANSQLKG